MKSHVKKHHFVVILTGGIIYPVSEKLFAPQIGWDSLAYENLQHSFSMLDYVSDRIHQEIEYFNFQQTKPLYQNNLKHNLLYYFLHFSRAVDVISYL